MENFPGYWQRVSATEPEDTVEGFERAAEMRYYDGQELLAQPGRLSGAVYLLGYCVELVLKAAYCRIVGVGPSDPVWGWLAAAGLQTRSVKHHKIADLYDLVAAERMNRGFGKKPEFEGQIKMMSLLSASHWKEELRYRSVPATRSEAQEMDEATTWIMIHREDLWR